MLRAVWRAYLAASRAPSREATAVDVAAGALPSWWFAAGRADSAVSAAAAAATLMPLVLDGRLTRWCDMSSPIERRFFLLLPFEVVLLNEGMVAV